MTQEAGRLAAGLHPLERAVVPHLKKEGTLAELAAATKLQEVEAMRALQWLEGKGCLTLTGKEIESLQITQRGKDAAKHGLPEAHALAILKKQGTLFVADIPKTLPTYDKMATGAVIGSLKKLNIPFVTIDNKPAFRWVDALTIKESDEQKLLAKVQERIAMDDLTEEERKAAAELVKRQGYAELVKQRTKEYALTPLGQELAKAKELHETYEERLTPAMLKDGSWKNKKFRPYNVTINVPKISGGRVHYVNEAINAIKKIWLELGFEEMDGNHVQTAFWDLDVLFVPQDHPAREMQDTFYLADPASGKLPASLLKRVKAAHEHGGDTGSLGWRYTFSDEEAAKNLLRTHTTVLSAHTLHKIKHGEKKIPGKYFSVNKIYRNEALDWKHLFELHQVEGIVVDEHANMQHLKGYLREFFGKMGFPDVRIRPAHFPYTEPSAEVDVWDPQRKTWVELGGAGIFRPEVVKTVLGKEVPVLAWGLGMERSIMRYYQFTDIRDIYKNDLEQLKTVKAWLE